MAEGRHVEHVTDHHDAFTRVGAGGIDRDQRDGLGDQVDERRSQVLTADRVGETGAAHPPEIDRGGIRRQRTDGAGDHVGQAEVGAVAVARGGERLDRQWIHRVEEQPRQAEHRAAAHRRAGDMGVAVALRFDQRRTGAATCHHQGDVARLAFQRQQGLPAAADGLHLVDLDDGRTAHPLR